MRLLRSRFLQAVLILVLAFVILRFGIRPPAPWSVLTLYLAIIFMAVMVFVSSDRDSWRSFIGPIWTTLVRPERRPLRIALVIVIPLLVGYYAYTQAAAKPQAPPELRAVHPAPPASIQFRNKEFNISGAENPLRKDAAKFREFEQLLQREQQAPRASSNVAPRATAVAPAPVYREAPRSSGLPGWVWGLGSWHPQRAGGRGRSRRRSGASRRTAPAPIASRRPRRGQALLAPRPAPSTDPHTLPSLRHHVSGEAAGARQRAALTRARRPHPTVMTK